MAGLGPSAEAFEYGEREPVYLLTNRRSSRPPSPYAFSDDELRALSDELSVIRPRSPRVSSEADLLASSEDWEVIRARSPRSRSIRLVGFVAIVAALTGTTVLLRQQPKAAHELLSFVTMGHAEDATRLVHRFGALVGRAKTP